MNADRLQEIRAAGILAEEEIAALETGERLRAPERPRFGLAGFLVSWMGFAVAAWVLTSPVLPGAPRGPHFFFGVPLFLLPIAALLLHAGSPSGGAVRGVRGNPVGLALQGRTVAWAALALLALLFLRSAA
jgi:hypothetical protein